MAETTEQYRNRINQIKTSVEQEPAIRKMRDDIAEGISKTGNRQADIEVRQDNLESDFVAVQQDASAASPSGAEVAVARGGHSTLDERLTKKEQEVTAQLAQTIENINKREINIMFPPEGITPAVGDGLTDSRKTIQDCMDYLSAKGGGKILIPIGVFLLNSTLVEQGDFTIFIPRDNVTIEGVGSGSVLKVANGMNERYRTLNAPNIFLKTTLLQNFSLINFMVDWNGFNNLLTSEHKTRSNAVLYGSAGGKNILVKKLIVKDLPGNQAIFFSDVNVETVGAGSIIVEECEFLNCGSGLAGNYNQDHSTVFLSGKGDRIRNNKFKSTGMVLGSPFEIHGANSQAYGNDIENYTIGFWIAPHVNDLKDTLVSDNLFRGIILAWGWGAGQNVGEHGGSVKIQNNKFYYKVDSETYRPNDVFSIEGAKVVTHRMVVDNNEFISEGVKNKTFMQVYKTKNFVFTRNKLENFTKQALLFAFHDFGTDYAIDTLIVKDNEIVNCGLTSDVIQIETGASLLKARVLKINNNDILLNSAATTNAIRLGIDAEFGEILDNNISVNYLNPFYLFAKSSKIKIRHVGEKDQTNGIYGDITSVVTNKTTGTVFTKKETNSTSWKRTIIGTMAPSSGIFAVGDEVINYNPTVGSYKGWVCVTSGTPGTWKGYGLIQT